MFTPPLIDLLAPICGARDIFFMGNGAALGFLETFARNGSFFPFYSLESENGSRGNIFYAKISNIFLL